MDGGEEAGAQVVVQVLVLGHLKHLLPLLDRHLVLHTLSRLILLPQGLATKLTHTHTKCYHYIVLRSINVFLLDHPPPFVRI